MMPETGIPLSVENGCSFIIMRRADCGIKKKEQKGTNQIYLLGFN